MHATQAYGAGNAKIGSIVGQGEQVGAQLKAKFLSSLPALAALIEDLKAAFESRGCVKGLDGRKLYIKASKRVMRNGKERWERSTHKALNTLLQSAGALVMKKALVLSDAALQAAGLVPGKDYEFVLNVHDEMQAETHPAHAQFVGETMRASIVAAGEYFKLRCRLDGEFKIGANWAETH